jgi:heme-binding NEAT domain protein
MANNKDKKVTSEVQEYEQTSEVQETVKAGMITMDEYLKQVKVNPLLVASFTYEGKFNHPEMLEPKTADGWTEAFEAQSKRTYN